MGRKDYTGEIYINDRKVITESDIVLSKIQSIQSKLTLYSKTIGDMPQYLYRLDLPLAGIPDEEIEFLKSQYTLSYYDNSMVTEEFEYYEYWFDFWSNSTLRINVEFKLEISKDNAIVWESADSFIQLFGESMVNTTIISYPKEYYNSGYTFNCVILGINIHTDQIITELNERTNIIKKRLDTEIGDISTALDELHEYAQSLVSGGTSE